MSAAAFAAFGAAFFEYRRRGARSARAAVRAAEALTGAQLRAQLAETAVSIGKLAAALSHEINSPLGVIRGGIEMLASAEKRGQMTPAQLDDLVAGIRESAARIEEVTERLRRLANLEESDLKSADLNELLSGVALIHETEIAERNIVVALDFDAALPALACRPQLLTAAFSSMLRNALEAVNGDGRIAISTRCREAEIEVTIRDNGRGMTAEEAEGMFDPSLKVTGARVASGNWSLFNARQIVYEHGGAISVETAPGAGTTLRVTLPAGC